MGRHGIVRGIGAGVAAVALLALSMGAAFAAKPIHENVDETGSTTVCGIPITVHYTGVVNTFVDSSGNTVKMTGALTGVLTYPATGKSVSDSFRGQTRYDDVFNSDGTETLTVTFTGQPFRVTNGNPQVLLQDVGRIIEVITFDANGNLVSSAFTFEKGKHPNADSGGDLYCSTLVAALS